MRGWRRFYQVFFLLLFFLLLFTASQGRIKGYPITLFLDASPLNGLATLLSAGNVAHTMWIGFAILGLSFLLGRFFCGWICPLGTIFDFASKVFTPRTAARRKESGQHTAAQRIKYIILIVLLVLAACRVLQVGWFDPIALLTRVGAVFLAPAASAGWGSLATDATPRSFPTGWLITLIFTSLLLLNAWRPRFWCRYLCPLGALLGAAAKFSIGAVVRNTHRCNDCGLCAQQCPAACEPDKKTRTAECFICGTCLPACPKDALSWSWHPAAHATNTATGVSRRQFFSALFGGAAAFACVRLGGALRTRGWPRRIRPPGALDEVDFMARCLKCGACMKVCPTNVIQPALLESGVEGLWTPVLDMRQGYCELNCVLCGQACPTGAIQRLTLEQKNRMRNGHPLKIGTAFVDRNRCLPWAMGRQCLVCQEVCPVSPKAIKDIEEEVAMPGGETRRLRRPYIDAAQCIGCGLCEHECPVADQAAIRVTSVGESRQPGGSFYL